MIAKIAARLFPSPLWGGARGGGKPDSNCSAIPPSLSLPHKGGGNTRGMSIVLLMFALLVLPASNSGAQTKAAEEAPEQYPAGEHRDDTFYFCTACHGFKIVAQQGQSRERWNETIDIMTSRHGMVDVQGEQREQMLDYLSKAFPERRAPGGWKNPFER
jgi:hypothetical protein